MDSAAILRNSRREAVFTVIVWVLACLYTVGYAGLFAYRGPGEQPELIGGMPSWVVWGVVLPWFACTAVTCWYAMCGIVDEDLGEEADTAASHGLTEAEAARG